MCINQLDYKVDIIDMYNNLDLHFNDAYRPLPIVFNSYGEFDMNQYHLTTDYVYFHEGDWKYIIGSFVSFMFIYSIFSDLMN